MLKIDKTDIGLILAFLTLLFTILPFSDIEKDRKQSERFESLSNEISAIDKSNVTDGDYCEDVVKLSSKILHEEDKKSIKNNHKDVLTTINICKTLLNESDDRWNAFRELLKRADTDKTIGGAKRLIEYNDDTLGIFDKSRTSMEHPKFDSLCRHYKNILSDRDKYFMKLKDAIINQNRQQAGEIIEKIEGLEKQLFADEKDVNYEKIWDTARAFLGQKKTERTPPSDNPKKIEHKASSNNHSDDTAVVSFWVTSDTKLRKSPQWNSEFEQIGASTKVKIVNHIGNDWVQIEVESSHKIGYLRNEEVREIK